MRQRLKIRQFIRPTCCAAAAAFTCIVAVSGTYADVVIIEGAQQVPAIRPMKLIAVDRAQVRFNPQGFTVVGGDIAAPESPDEQSFLIAAGEDASVRRKLEDFNDLVTAKKWMQAFTLLEDLSTATPAPMIRTESGFIAPFATFRRTLIEGMPEEGRKAFGVMFDPKAKQLWEATQNAEPDDEIELLERLTTHYPTTEPSDAAIVRLGDAYFEAGQFGRAVDVWSSLRPTAATPPAQAARHWVRLATAAKYAGDQRVWLYSGEQIRKNFADVTVRLGREDHTAIAAYEAISNEAATVAVDKAPAAALNLPRRIDGRLMFEIIPAQMQQQIKAQALQRGLGVVGLANLVNINVIGDRLLVSTPGWRAAYVADKAEPVWQVGNAQAVANFADQLLRYQIDARQSLEEMENAALITSTDFNRTSYTQMSLIDPATGAERWSSASKNDMIALGTHIMHRDKLYAVTLGTSGASLTLQAINVANGNVESSLALGSSRTFASQGNYSPIKPAIAAAGDMLYVQTNDGAVIAVDAQQMQIAWAMKYDVNIPMQIARRNYQVLASMPHGNIAVHEDLIVTKDRMSSAMVAIDSHRKQFRWKVDVGQTADFMGVHHGLALVVDGGIAAYDATTGQRVWWSDLADMRKASMLLTEDLLIAVTSERLYAFSLDSGKVLAFSEIAGLQDQPGNLMLHDGTLYVVDGMRVLTFNLFKKEN
jgi:outer membrane protein assembly factor BamB